MGWTIIMDSDGQFFKVNRNVLSLKESARKQL